MNKVLFITYQWAPHNSAGTLRALGLARYLPQYGYQPIILCNDYDTIPDWTGHRGLSDETLQIPEGLEVHRIAATESSSRFARLLGFLSWPSNWAKGAFGEAIKICNTGGVIGAWCQIYPRGPLWVGRELRRRCGIPWIADYLDPLDRDYHSGVVCRLKAAILYRMEKKLLKSAAAVSIVTPAWQKRLRRRLHREVLCIPNGYDPEFLIPATAKKPLGVFRIVHVGNICHEMFGHFEAFLKVIVKLRHAGMLRQGVELACYGNAGKDIEAIVSRAKATDFVRLYGRSPYREVLHHLVGASALMFLPFVGQGRHTSKLMDYLGSGVPIVCFPDDPAGAGDVIRETGAGIIANTEEELADWLIVLASRGDSPALKGWAPPERRRQEIEKYTWPVLAGKLAEVLNHLVDRRNAWKL